MDVTHVPHQSHRYAVCTGDRKDALVPNGEPSKRIEGAEGTPGGLLDSGTQPSLGLI